MKPADRALALKVHRLALKNVGYPEIARRLKLSSAEAAFDQAMIGRMITEAEGFDLTEREWRVMKTLARVQARRIALGAGAPKATDVDHAAGERSGWTAKIVDKRLRERRPDEQADAGPRLGFVYLTERRLIRLTPPGWAFAWAAGLIKPNWRVSS